jgi:hypothetical protein
MMDAVTAARAVAARHAANGLAASARIRERSGRANCSSPTGERFMDTTTSTGSSSAARCQPVADDRPYRYPAI